MAARRVSALSLRREATQGRSLLAKACLTAADDSRADRRALSNLGWNRKQPTHSPKGSRGSALLSTSGSDWLADIETGLEISQLEMVSSHASAMLSNSP
eukprot:3366942-Prymnesium_polylepis.1